MFWWSHCHQHVAILHPKTLQYHAGTATFAIMVPKHHASRVSWCQNAMPAGCHGTNIPCWHGFMVPKYQFSPRARPSTLLSLDPLGCLKPPKSTILAPWCRDVHMAR